MGLAESWFGGLVAGLVHLIMQALGYTGPLSDGHIPGLSLVLLLGFLIFVGWVASYPFGHQKLRLIDVVFTSIPGVKVIYAGVRKIGEALGDPNHSRFKRAVLIDFPAKPFKAFAFVTAETTNTVDGRKYLAVFVPHVPNPTSGVNVFVPEDETVDTGLTPDEAFKVAMSLGILTPGSVTITAPSKPVSGGAGSDSDGPTS